MEKKKKTLRRVRKTGTSPGIGEVLFMVEVTALEFLVMEAAFFRSCANMCLHKADGCRISLNKHKKVTP
ncbi:hypothetical protein J7E37_06025 [Bacillus sp. ISL-39]|nr:hypothetical protein [Bacillus sp. ISL-39]